MFVLIRLALVQMAKFKAIIQVFPSLDPLISTRARNRLLPFSLGITIVPADYFGGAGKYNNLHLRKVPVCFSCVIGGRGFYPVARRDSNYTLKLTEHGHKGVNYFGKLQQLLYTLGIQRNQPRPIYLLSLAQRTTPVLLL